MPDLPPTDGPGLEVTSPDGSRQFVRITESPFLIGRGVETGNHLPLRDRRISRHCAAIISEGDRYCLEDRGHRQDIFVNGTKIDRCVLEDGDAISFGFENSYEMTFHAADVGASLQNLLTRIENISSTDPTSRGLRKLNLLLEATSLLHSQLPLDSVLGTMLDHAIGITDADRGILMEGGPNQHVRSRLARSRGGQHLPTENLAPSQTALRQALEKRAAVITKDLTLADQEL